MTMGASFGAENPPYTWYGDFCLGWRLLVVSLYLVVAMSAMS
jgi:hypothetical protein